ncbi:hypothetical protein [Streptomyces sp. PR69]|uniref:hypothetical protein n=1 Tax=Streptomyces sp. PR69 TaxID=2984950 RepID=UPI002264EC42|nr:hypothetical protein [Streptomyces sp. PR69]
MSIGELSRLACAVDVLAGMSGPFGHLPVTDVTVGTTYRPDAYGPVIVISVHEGLADFEAWREALGIRPEDVTHRLLPNCASLTAEAEWGGVWIELHGYGPLPATAPAPAPVGEAVA